MPDSEVIPVKSMPPAHARIIAKNAVPEVIEAFRLMGIPAACFKADVPSQQSGAEWRVVISIASSEAYDLARWVRSRVTPEEAAALVFTEEKKEQT